MLGNIFMYVDGKWILSVRGDIVVKLSWFYVYIVC